MEELIMRISRIAMSPEEQARMEYYSYLVKRQEATIEYIAMMTDVELPEESDGDLHEQEI